MARPVPVVSTYVVRDLQTATQDRGDFLRHGVDSLEPMGDGSDYSPVKVDRHAV